MSKRSRQDDYSDSDDEKDDDNDGNAAESNTTHFNKLINYEVQADDIFKQLEHDFQDMMKNKEKLRGCIDKFIDNIVDELTLGIIFDYHRKVKTDACYYLEIDSDDEVESAKEFLEHQHSSKKNQNCACPICEASVAACRFASHLKGCMGLSRRARLLRNASQKQSNTIGNNSKDKSSDNMSFSSSLYNEISSDNDDDIEWSSSCSSSTKQKKRSGKKGRSSKRKNKASTASVSKVTYSDDLSSDVSESSLCSVDIEGADDDDDDELTSLRDLLSSSSGDSASNSPTTVTAPKKRKEKTKKRSRVLKEGSNSPPINNTVGEYLHLESLE